MEERFPLHVFRKPPIEISEPTVTADWCDCGKPNGPIAIKKYFCKGCKDFEKITFFLPNGKPLPGDLFYCKNKEYINRRGKNEPVYLSDNPDYETPGDCPYLDK